MKRYLIITLLLLVAQFAIAQNKPGNTKPVIIEGRITGLKSGEITIGYHIEDGYIYEECKVDKDGDFYLRSDKFTQPVTAELGSGKSLLTYIYIAPSYHLKITADGSSVKSFYLTKQVSGYGSAANKFIFKRDSALMRSEPSKEWFTMNKHDLLKYVNRRKKIQDSIANITLKRKSVPDNYYAYFKERAILNMKFDRLYYLVNHAIDDKTLSAQQAVDFVKDNFEPEANNISYNPATDYLPKKVKPGILNNLFNEEFLKSDMYRNLMANDYFIFIWEQQYRKDSTKVDKKRYNIDFIKIIASDYKGKVRDMVLYNKLESVIRYCRSYEELYDYEKAFPKYIDQLPDTGKRARLYTAMKDKEKELAKIAIGQPAPMFTAIDSIGKKYTLDNFKGKIVYVDLWASWCGPCRGETPYLKQVYEKYKNDPRVVFVSVAVLDERDKWLGAVREDKPTWLQLFDNEGTAQRAFLANSIPKFVTIDEQGKIVSLDSPPPSNEPELSKIFQVAKDKYK